MWIVLVTPGTGLELEIIFPEIQIPMPHPIHRYLAPLYKKQKILLYVPFWWLWG
jgi:hypothetical protein